MGLVIHNEKITPENAELLKSICPFGAISYDGQLHIGAGCKMCKMCVRKGPAGAVTFEEEKVESIDKSQWCGIAVYAELKGGMPHPVVYELIGKAKELTKVTHQKVMALLIGCNTEKAAKELLCYGVDTVYVYDDEIFTDFTTLPYTAAFTDFIEKVKPSAILVGASSEGRSLAPRVAARVHTGLTADCTMLEMKENTDLVQIRPAFGGNIMARIVTPNNRPQFCTVRYKIFSAPAKEAPHGEIIRMKLPSSVSNDTTKVIKIVKKPEEIDISDADVIIAVGRGLKSKDDVKLINELAEEIGAKIACTRPLVEAGWFDAKKQIGLSGRTVKPKLIITAGVSGSVQFASGMKSSDTIIAINTDKNASIFDVAHYGFVGDLYDILPRVIKKIKEAKSDVQ